MIDLALPNEMVLFPEWTSLCTLETALEMSTYALVLSCPEITACSSETTDPDLLAATTVLRSIRALQRDLCTYRRVLGLATPNTQPGTLLAGDSASTGGEQPATTVADDEQKQDRNTS